MSIEELQRETRVRIGVKQTAKGSIQMDITAESPTVRESISMLSDAMVELRKAVHEEAMKMIDED